MRLVPEYDPVQKLFLCFVQDFYNTRFSYGSAICEIIQAARRYVEIDLLVSPADQIFFQNECDKKGLHLEGVILNEDSPQRGILAEYVPIFAENEEGKGVGLIFKNPFLENPDELKRFSERMTWRLGFETLQTGFDFATAFLLVNEDLVLLSDRLPMGVDGQEKIRFFEQQFPNQSFHVVPALAGDVTGDLDMYLWPIAPRTWIVSEYPPGTVQEESIAPALRWLREHEQTVLRVPGLEPIIYDDINTMPNYTNGVIVNRAALVPAYQRREDGIAAGILKEQGFEVHQIDCSRLILSNSAIHCISKTTPLL